VSALEAAVKKMPKVVGMISIVVGAIAIVVGIGVYLEVRSQLTAQHITVAEDAPHLGGKDVTGPFTAYEQAVALNQHALDAGGGQTYAELPQDDPSRSTVMTADFLQASLYTSVVAFGVAFLIAILGVMFILLGLAFRVLDERTRAAVEPAEPTLAST
jgi:hypothetical protein